MDNVAALPAGFVIDPVPATQSAAAPPPGFSIDPTPPQQPLSWGDVGKQALQNAPSSAVHFAKDIAQPFMYPIDTAESLKNVGEGVLEKTGLMSGHEHEPYADAVGQFFANRYGSIDAFKHALAKDPVGVAGDLSMLLTGGGSALARAPGIAGKIGEVAATVGDVANPMMGAAKLAGATVGKLGKFGKVSSEGVPSTEDLRAAADEAYSHPAIKELSVKPSAVQDWRGAAATDLNDQGFTDELAPRTHGVLRHIDKLAAEGPISGQKLDVVRKMLGRAASVPDATERAAASHAIGSLDNFVAEIPEGAVLKGDPQKVSQVLADARGNYAAAKRSETVSGAVDRAKLNADSANSGQNIDNATRQRIKAILTNDKARRGYSAEEIRQMQKIVKGTFKGNVARFAGNLMGGGGGLGSTVSASIGAAAAGPIGAATPVLGYALKKLGSAVTSNEVNKLQSLIRSRSPLANQIEAPLKKWAEADVAHRASPSARTLARLTLASRNLSHNLADAGIQASPAILMGNGGQQQQDAEIYP